MINKNSVLLILLAFFTFVDPANSESLRTRAGNLSVAGESGSYDQKLILNRKIIKSSDAYSISIIQNYRLQASDVAIVEELSGGTGCPASYFAVVINDAGLLGISPNFGNCSDLITTKQVGQSIEISMPKEGLHNLRRSAS